MINVAPKLASAPQVSPSASAPLQFLEVVHDGGRRGDEHIIPRISLLTMPIYFDNQLTVVPVQPPMGQWFIGIDQFWVTSCAAVWGQTQAWLAVQSGVLSNARPWLTAHQHAELNSLAKCFPFAPISHSYTTMNARLHWNKTLSHSHILLLHFSIHMIRQLREKSTLFRTHSITRGAAGERLHIFIWRALNHISLH